MAVPWRHLDQLRDRDGLLDALAHAHAGAARKVVAVPGGARARVRPWCAYGASHARASGPCAQTQPAGCSVRRTPGSPWRDAALMAQPEGYSRLPLPGG